MVVRGEEGGTPFRDGQVKIIGLEVFVKVG